MERIEKSDIFIDHTNVEGRMSLFHNKLKKHLSNEYLFLSDKKDNLENEIHQLEMEQKQKDKTLFPHVEKRDIRKYFSPLNLSQIDEEQRDESKKQFSSNISRINEEIDLLDARMQEIKNFLKDMEDILQKENREEKREKLDQKEICPVSMKDIFEEDFDHFSFCDNLKQIAGYFENKYNPMEIILEFQDNEKNINREVRVNILKQLIANIYLAITDYGISIMLIEGEITETNFTLTLSYITDDGPMDAFKISYNIDL